MLPAINIFINLKISHTGKTGINSSNWKGGRGYKKVENDKRKLDEFKEKCRKRLVGKKQSAETIAKRVAKNTGKKRTIEQKIRIAESLKGKYLKENAWWAWKGGKSFEPYGLEFDVYLKEVIINRDRRKCQMCGKTELENGRKLSVHHIDYNKLNNDPKNLITLCISCHGKTTTNRDYWIKFFKLGFNNIEV